MSNFVQKTLLRLTSYNPVLFLVGLGMMAFAGYSIWLASGDNAYTQRDQLQTVSGFVAQASEVTVTGRRGRSKEKYYQIDVKPKGGGETLELRIRYNVPPQWIQTLIQENVTVLYDSDNTVYEAAVQGKKPEITYEGTRDHYIHDAESTLGIVSTVWWWGIAVFMLALGVGGRVLQRRLTQQAEAEATTT
ncbi:MAG: hypothetical protein LBF93_13065 [Zoogloeaceae bacterium]|jgi:hypothetical protein|nr:hypothetical protein [Zoogloeaceae bacterium]